MEQLFIVVMIVIFLVEYKRDIIRKILSTITSNPHGTVKYLGAVSVLSITLSLLPGLLLTIYMREKGFFAYEVFGNQQHSINILSLNVFINLIILSLGFFSSAILIAVKAGWIPIIASFFFNVIYFLLMILFAISSGKYLLVITIIIFCFLIAAYLFFWVKSGIEEKAKFWWIPLAFSSILILAPITFSSNAAQLVENGLSQMKVGGIDIELIDNQVNVSGKLVLRTPELIYFIPSNNPEVIQIMKLDHFSLQYKPRNEKKK